MALRKYYSGRVNVSDKERICSAVAGGDLLGFSLTRKRPQGFLLGLLGGALIGRGIIGKSIVYNALGINTADQHYSPATTVKHQEGVKVESSIIIHRSAQELFRYWRNFHNLPQFMENLESVTITGPNESHWVAKGPGGKKVEWDAVVHNEIPDELIAWRSVDESVVDHAGSVHFSPTPDGRGTEVKVVMNYSPPAGRITSVLSRLTGDEPGQQIDRALQRLKDLFESQEISTFEHEEAIRR